MGVQREQPSAALDCSVTALYEAYYNRLRRSLLRFVGSRSSATRDEVDDATQEAFRRVIERRSRGLDREGWTNALGYLFTIARNAYVERRRRRSRERAISLELAAGRCTSIDERVDEGQIVLQLRSLRAYVRALPDSTRAIYEARFVDEVSQKGTARRLGLTRRAGANTGKAPPRRGRALAQGNVRPYGLVRRGRTSARQRVLPLGVDRPGVFGRLRPSSRPFRVRVVRFYRPDSEPSLSITVITAAVHLERRLARGPY